MPRGSPVRTGEAASSKLPPQARGQPNRARDAARRGPVAPRSRGDCRRRRGQRASTVSTSATSARRRPGTAPRPEAARARASNSDVLQGEASITSRRRRRVARPAPIRGRRPVHALAHLRCGASSRPRARATSNGSGGSVPGRQENKTFFDGHGRLRRGDHRRGRGSDDAFRNPRGSQSVASELHRRVSRQLRPRSGAAHRLGPWRSHRAGGRRALKTSHGGWRCASADPQCTHPPLTAGLRRSTCSPPRR